MKLNKLLLRDKEIFARYLNFSRHELSVFAFENIYTWSGLFDIRWALIRDNLCVFFRDKIGCFMYLPALGKVISPDTIAEAFRVMDGVNRNKDISRIENIEEKELHFYQELGFKCAQKYPEYICRRADLSQLSGNKFKSKRACLNYFLKHYRYEYLPFSQSDGKACLNLFNSWKRQRMVNNQDPVYQGMLEDSKISLKVFLGSCRNFDIAGRIVKIDGQVKAFTFGFKISRDTFCVLYEITDLSIKGLAQFIFWKFSSELKEYKYINIMDDSGLENLKKVKLSYQPSGLVAAYIAKRKNG